MLQRLISSKTLQRTPKQSRWIKSTAAEERNMHVHRPFKQFTFVELVVAIEI